MLLTYPLEYVRTNDNCYDLEVDIEEIIAFLTEKRWLRGQEFRGGGLVFAEPNCLKVLAKRGHLTPPTEPAAYARNGRATCGRRLDATGATNDAAIN